MSKRVLIVDSDKQLLPVVKDVLQRVGFEVFVEQDRDKAVSLAKKQAPDLILLSVELPAGAAEGYLVCKDLKSDAETKSIPIILMSRKAKEADFAKHRKLKTRADDYLKKPFTDEELFQRIENLLGFQVSDKEYNKLEEKLHGFLEEKERLEEQLEDRDHLVAELEEELKTLRARNDGSVDAAELEEANAELKALKERTKELEIELEGHQTQTKTEKKKLEETLEETRNEFGEKLAEARTEIDEKNEQIEGLEAELEELRASEEGKREELKAEYESDLEDLRKSLDKAVEAQNQISEEYEELKETHFELEKRMETLKEENEAEFDAYRDRLNAVAEAFLKAREALESAQEHLPESVK